MSNVLPRDRRRAVWALYRARFLAGVSLLILLAALISALAFLPSYLVLQLGEAQPKTSVQSVQSAQQDRAAIAQAQALIAALSPLVSATTTASDAIEAAVAARPPGTTISHVTATAGAPGTIIVTGTAQGSGALVAYQSALKADPHFSAVTVPVSDLAGASSGQFSVTLTSTF